MAAGSQPSRSEKPSIKYRYNPLEGVSFGLADLGHEDYAPTSSDNSHNTKHNGEKSEPKSSEIFSTADLVSAASQMWDYAIRPFSVFRPKRSSAHNDGETLREILFQYRVGCGNDNSSTAAKGQYSLFNSMNISHSSPTEKASLECLKVSQKLSVFEPCHGSYTNSLLWGLLKGEMLHESWRNKGLAGVGISYDPGSIYGWMSETTVARLRHFVNPSKLDEKKTVDCCIAGHTSSPAICCHPGNITGPTNNLITENADLHTEITKPMHLSGQNGNPVMSMRTSIASIYSDYHLGPVQLIEANTSASRLLADYHINILSSGTPDCEESVHMVDEDGLHENKKNQQNEVVIEDETKIEVFSSTQGKHCYALAKQEHAFAGAMAGIFVSLCLHPVDTIKTVIQSCRFNQNSIHHIGRSIITERGVTGLYRGITSNVASSAPISAVYTFTYESVKGALLPLFPKEYISLVHCMAGGCASIATSVIFTPSERIKQQMQVGSHYQNCWNALIGILRKGGLPSLYTGWGAVLCRNVPHSIIKFYAYESLKQWMLSSFQSTTQPNTILTLVSGGLAGSTAALFTTPFDVVKTRLQTQIPGTINHYDGVFNTLKEIGKHEGLKGLYR
ncbi:unnamed protein product [Ilex paraguariensis]